MKFVKGLAISLLGFLLFLSLSVFGLSFMLNRTILNPGFVINEINQLNISSLLDELLSQQVSGGDLPPEISTAISNATAKLEPAFKEQADAATRSIYDYLLGKKPEPRLAATLTDTILSEEFISSVVDELDIHTLAVQFFDQQISQHIPQGIELWDTYLKGSLDKTLIEQERWLKEQLCTAIPPILSYLVGESQDLGVVIPLDPLMETLEENARQAYLQSPPPELAGATQTMLQQFFDMAYPQLTAQMPSSYEVDRSMFQSASAGIVDALTEAETMLEEARTYIAGFQFVYWALIVFMVLLIAGIVLIIRRVKGTTRELGTTFTTYGALEYAGVLVTNYFTGKELGQISALPSALQTWLPQLIQDFMNPLEIFSLVLLIMGIILIVASFVYKRGEAAG